MKPEYVIFISILGLLLGCVFTLIDFHRAENSKSKKLLTVIERGLLYGILSFALTTGIDSKISIDRFGTSINKFDENLSKIDKYYKASDCISNIDYLPAKGLFGDGLSDLTNELDHIVQRKLFLGRHKILQTFEYMVKNAKADIMATNIVSEDDWKAVTKDGKGASIQKEAINRGVRIRRLFIYDDKNQGHLKGLLDLAKSHKAVRIEVKIISLSSIRNDPMFESYKRDLNELIDIIITDNSLIMQTDVNSSNYKMNWAMLNCDKNYVLKASEFWNHFWERGSELSEFKI